MWDHFLIAHEADDIIYLSRGQDLDKVDAVEWDDHRGDIFLQIMEVHSIAAARVVNDDELIGCLGQSFNFTGNWIFVGNVNNNA
jgi:hypothetical protein